MYWKEILQFYEDMGVEDIIPIAHTRVKPNIKVLLDESGNFVGAMLKLFLKTARRILVTLVMS